MLQKTRWQQGENKVCIVHSRFYTLFCRLPCFFFWVTFLLGIYVFGCLVKGFLGMRNYQKTHKSGEDLFFTILRKSVSTHTSQYWIENLHTFISVHTLSVVNSTYNLFCTFTFTCRFNIENWSKMAISNQFPNSTDANVECGVVNISISVFVVVIYFNLLAMTNDLHRKRGP